MKNRGVGGGGGCAKVLVNSDPLRPPNWGLLPFPLAVTGVAQRPRSLDHESPLIQDRSRFQVSQAPGIGGRGGGEGSEDGGLGWVPSSSGAGAGQRVEARLSPNRSMRSARSAVREQVRDQREPRCQLRMGGTHWGGGGESLLAGGLRELGPDWSGRRGGGGRRG